jgi:hypothetical protein
MALDGARHEARSFPDEEAAYFYLFGVLAAEAVRNGALLPAVVAAGAQHELSLALRLQQAPDQHR